MAFGSCSCNSGGGNWAEKVAKTGLFPFWPPEGADVEVDFFEAGEPPLLLELLLKSLLKKEFFLSKLFELEPLLTTLDCADAVEEVVVVGPPLWCGVASVDSVSSPFSSAPCTCLSALAASFLDKRSDPPLEDRLLSDFLEIRRDWLLSRLNELFGDEFELDPLASPGDRLAA